MSEWKSILVIGGLAIVFIIVVLGIIVGQQEIAIMTPKLPNSASNLQNTTNAIGEQQDKVDILKMIMSFFEKLFGFVK